MGERRGEEGASEEVGRGQGSGGNSQGKAAGGRTGAQVRSLGESLRGRGLDWEALGQSMGITGCWG